MASTISVPTSSLAVSPDSGDDQPGVDVMPQVGDTVQFTVSGKVQSIDGENAVVAPDSFNDEPVKGNASEPNTADNLDDGGSGGSSDMETHLRGLAKKADDDEDANY